MIEHPKPAVYGDIAVPEPVKELTRALMREVIVFYEQQEHDPGRRRARVYAIMNSLAITSATVVAGTQDFAACEWFLEAFQRNVSALLEGDRPPPPGATKQ